jgi:hypothetical protein
MRKLLRRFAHIRLATPNSLTFDERRTDVQTSGHFISPILKNLHRTQSDSTGRTQLVNAPPIRDQSWSLPRFWRVFSVFHLIDSVFAHALPRFLCIFLLTSTGHMPQIVPAVGNSPQCFLRFSSCQESPLWHSHNSNGYDPCPGRFTGSRSLRSLPAGSVPHPKQ